MLTLAVSAVLIVIAFKKEIDQQINLSFTESIKRYDPAENSTDVFDWDEIQSSVS